MAQKLGITGSGAIACGLARAASEACEVVLWARSEASADRACANVEQAARVVTDLAELSACTIVVEAIAEEPQAKHELYERLAGVLSDDAVLATTTSSLSVSELAAASGRPDRFGALHVFNPVHRMELVELSFPDAAAESTRARLREFCARLGKTAVEVPRLRGLRRQQAAFFPTSSTPFACSSETASTKSIDTCMTLGAGHPMGPLALLDMVGLDVAASIGQSIGCEVPPRLRELIADGKLGRKAGAGFSSTTSQAARVPAVRSHTTSPRHTPVSRPALDALPGRRASGRSSQRARSSAWRGHQRRPGLGLCLDQRAHGIALRVARWRTASLRDLLLRQALPTERRPRYGRNRRVRAASGPCSRSRRRGVDAASSTGRGAAGRWRRPPRRRGGRDSHRLDSVLAHRLDTQGIAVHAHHVAALRQPPSSPNTKPPTEL